MKIISISMNDMLVHSWANDYQALQAMDLPMCADTSMAVPELTRLCRELLGKRRQEKSSHRSAAKRAWLRSTTAAAPNGAPMPRAKGSQKEISTAWLALGSSAKWSSEKTGCWSTATSNGWTRRLWDFTKPNQYLGRQRRCRAWATDRARHRRRISAKGYAVSSPSAFNPTATC